MSGKITGGKPVGYETPQISGTNVKVSSTNPSDSKVNASQVQKPSTVINPASVSGSALNVSSAYNDQQRKMSLEADLNEMIKLIMPDLGVRFRIHESTGEIITSVINNETDDVVREFPSEKILELVHNMCKRLGIFVNRKV